MSRKKPYTQIGMLRLKCFRCGAPAVHQWQVCSDGNVYRPLCLACDIGLNDAALRYMRHPRRRQLIAAYRKKHG